MLEAITRLDACRIKGLGPAAANLLYFIHPTLVPPFNTAIVNGDNALTGSKVKLGRWPDYLAMRTGVLETGTFDMDALMQEIHGTYAGTNTCAEPFDHGQMSLTKR